ncbi:MAG: hypothetical protein IPL35_09050 [Sphingobacteriales bacterium]|nr:hypothetical protein [Sphingobacteriales bacterium]
MGTPDVGITTYYFIGNNGICEFADSFQVQVIPQVNAGNDVTLCPKILRFCSPMRPRSFFSMVAHYRVK